MTQSALQPVMTQPTFKPTDKVDDYIIINTGASAGIGNANEDYGAHKEILNGPIVEFADGSSKQVTSTDILPIASLPPEACAINKFDGGKTLLAIQQACDSGIDFLFQSKGVTAIDKYGNKTPLGLRHPTLNLWVIPKKMHHFQGWTVITSKGGICQSWCQQLLGWFLPRNERRAGEN